MFTKSQIADLRLTYAAELRGLSDASIDETVIDWIRAERREAEDAARRALPEKKAAAREAFDREVARYKDKNPQGKNDRKAGMRAARAIWPGFGT